MNPRRRPRKSRGQRLARDQDSGDQDSGDEIRGEDGIGVQTVPRSDRPAPIVGKRRRVLAARN